MSDDFDINKILEEKANSMEQDTNRDQHRQNIDQNTYRDIATDKINPNICNETEENSLLEETSHVIKKLRDYESCVVEIKKEITDICHNPDIESDISVKTEPETYSDDLIVPKSEEVTVKEEVTIKEESIATDYHITVERVNNTELIVDQHIKLEQNDDNDVVSYDFPQFDGQSISSNGSALGIVEAQLDDVVDIKNENDLGYEEIEKSCDIKCEPEFIERTNISTEAPTEQHDVPVPHQPTEIPNGANETSGFHSLFQLNSITGNCMSLEDEAMGLKPVPIKLKKVNPKNIPCPRCTNMYRTKYSLKAHLLVHASIDRYNDGRRRSSEKIKKRTKAKKVKPSQKTVVNHTKTVVNASNSKLDERFKYACTCGKQFKRRTTMESCLRSHDEGSGECSTFACIACTKRFKDKDELALHRKRLHNKKKFPCKFCPTEYSTQRKLVRHLRRHRKVQLTEFEVISKVANLKCPICKNACTDFSGLKTHITEKHTPPYQCRKCNELCNTILDFTTHLKSKHFDNNSDPVLDALEAFTKLAQEWKCEDCNLQFNNADELALHKLEEHTLETKSAIDAETQFQCVDCRRVFASSKSLNTHKRIHHIVVTEHETKIQEGGLLCVNCRKVCKDEAMLTSHMRFHSPDRKYVCKYCDFRFATPEKRRVHAEIHTGDLKFVCFICEYQCSSFHRLTKHKLSVKHLSMKEYLVNGALNGEKEIEEPKSGEIEEDGVHKKRRMSEEVKNEAGSSSDNEADSEFSCDICEAKFSSREIMLEHKQTHPFIEFPNDDKPTRIFFK